MTRRTLMVAFALVSSSCVPPRATEPRLVAAPPRAPASPGLAAADGADASSPEPAPAQPTPPPRTAVVPVATGLPGAPVVLWPFDLSDDDGTPAVVLFPEEKAALRRAVAEALDDLGIAVVPVEALERIEDAAAAGTLVLEDEQRCASPLSRSEVLARYFDDHPRVSIVARCSRACRLEVTLSEPGAGTRSFRSRTVKHPEDPQRWIAAARRLVEGGPEPHSPARFEQRPSAPIQLGSPAWVGRWSSPPTKAQFAALEPRAAACASADPMVERTHALRAQVGASGRVERCSVEDSRGTVNPADEACLCAALDELRLGVGSDRRRLRVDAFDEGFLPTGGVLIGLQPDTSVWTHRLRTSHALERCGESHPPGVRIDAVVSLRLAPDGRVEDARIDGNIVDLSAMQWARCIVQELRAVELPCRPPGIEELRTALILDIILEPQKKRVKPTL